MDCQFFYKLSKYWVSGILRSAHWTGHFQQPQHKVTWETESPMAATAHSPSQVDPLSGGQRFRGTNSVTILMRCRPWRDCRHRWEGTCHWRKYHHQKTKKHWDCRKHLRPGVRKIVFKPILSITSQCGLRQITPLPWASIFLFVKMGIQALGGCGQDPFQFQLTITSWEIAKSCLSSLCHHGLGQQPSDIRITRGLAHTQIARPHP